MNVLFQAMTVMFRAMTATSYDSAAKAPWQAGAGFGAREAKHSTQNEGLAQGPCRAPFSDFHLALIVRGTQPVQKSHALCQHVALASPDS